MTNNRWDGTLNGVKFRLTRGSGAYNRFFSRQQVEEQFILPTGGRTSREDRRKFYQTNWAEGATWFRPLITESNQGTYEYATGLDATKLAGALLPMNTINADSQTATRGMTTESPIIAAPPHSGSGASTAYGISSNTDGSFNYFLRYWNNTSGAWADSIGTIGSEAYKWGLVYDQNEDKYFAWDAIYISWTDGVTTTDNDAITITPRTGAAIVPGLLTKPYFFDGGAIYEIDTATSTLTTITDDGLGDTISLGIGGIFDHRRFRHAVGSAEGVYYMKNIWTRGQPQCWIFRVERDAAGNIISVPIATLPLGVLGLDLGFTMGTPVIIGTYAWSTALAHSGHFRTDVWSIFGGTLGLLGSFNILTPTTHDLTTPVETVTSIIGNHEQLLLLGSDQGIWAYDPVRGGVHHLYDTNPSDQECAHVPLVDQNRFLHQNTYITNQEVSFDLDTVAAIGDDVVTNVLYSNWFDFNLPGEEKTLTQIRTQVADIDRRSTNSWLIDIYDDDGVLTTSPGHQHDGNNGEHTSTGWSVTSERFRYRLVYNTTANAAPTPLISVILVAESGEIVQGWQLTIDGTEFENVENEKQDPEEVYDNWVTLGQNAAAVTFEDNFEAFDRADKTSHSVRIQNVSIQKEAPGEARIEVVLIDAD